MPCEQKHGSQSKEDRGEFKHDELDEILVGLGGTSWLAFCLSLPSFYVIHVLIRFLIEPYRVYSVRDLSIKFD